MWDVLLCDRPVARMVECIFVAMLVQIRHLRAFLFIVNATLLTHLWKLSCSLVDACLGSQKQCSLTCLLAVVTALCNRLVLQSDYGGCLQYLMRYPPIVDVSAFIQLALHYRNPKVRLPTTACSSVFDPNTSEYLQ